MDILVGFLGLIMFIYFILRLINSIFKPQKYNTDRKTAVKKTLGLFLVSFIALTILMAIVMPDEKVENKNANSQSQSEIIDNITVASQPIAIKDKPKSPDYSNIVYPYTKDYVPKLYARWGDEWIKRINKMMPLVVKKVASNPRCDEPEIIELSDNKSIVRKEAVFYVDCKNKERFYVSQYELD